MTYQLPDKIKKLKAYTPVEGSFDVQLNANESFYNLPSEIVEEIKKKLCEVAFHRYPDPLCKKVCQLLGELYKIPSDRITVGNGSDELISIILNTLLPKGAKVLTLPPDFAMYEFYGKLAELTMVTLEKEETLEINPDAVCEYIRENQVDALIFSNPCNPTSLLLPRDDVIFLLENTDCLVIVDEAYMEFSQGTVMDLVGQYNRLIVLKTLSKAFGLASIRLGFAVAGRTLSAAMQAAKSPYNVNTLTQVVAETLLSHKDWLRKATKDIVASKQKLEIRIRTEVLPFTQKITKVYDSATNFLYIETTDSPQIVQQMAQKGIAIKLSGDRIRITAGSAEENEKVVVALKEICSKK